MEGFPKLRGPIKGFRVLGYGLCRDKARQGIIGIRGSRKLGVIRIMLYWGPYWNSFLSGSYHIGFKLSIRLTTTPCS